MPDYSLGRAHGKIEIDYDGSGAEKAARDIDRTAASTDKLDESLTKAQRSLHDTEGGFDSAGDGARRYGRDIDNASTETERFTETTRNATHAVVDLDRTEDDYHRGRRSRSGSPGVVSHDDINVIHDATEATRDLGKTADKTEDTVHGMTRAIDDAADAIRVLGPEGAEASSVLESLSHGFSRVGSTAVSGGEHVRDFIKHIANFETSFAKISGLTLALPSLGGLAGIGGAATLQGVTNLAGALRQLSGALGLLPGVVAGVGLSMGTLKIAFHGVGDALKDMMVDDPKKFLEDLQHMGPAAAQSMMQIAQFRNMFKLAGAQIQDSFFKQIAGDIAPLIQTWLPQLTAAMSGISGAFGHMADVLAKTLMQPAALRAFSMFATNVANGLKSLEPAIGPLVNIFSELTVVGTGFFSQIGGQITQMLSFFQQVIEKAGQSGALQRWIQMGINAFGHLINIAYSFGAAFNHIMDIADKFGGGGLLGWLDKLTAQLNSWTQSASGQKALTDFFSAIRQATDAFLPMLRPLVDGLSSLFTAFTQLGVGIAPGWQTFFNTFAATMAQLGPQITAMAPALNQFLVGMSQAFAQLMAQVGPQLPQIFMMLSNAFVALLPQLGPLVQMFIELAEQVGPQLPKFFETVTAAIEQLAPRFPIIIGFVRDFVSVITELIQISGQVAHAITAPFQYLNDHADAIKAGVRNLIGEIGNFFKSLPGEAVQWGKDLVSGLAKGIGDATGLGAVRNATRSIVGGIARFFQHSPAIEGPFSGSGYTLIRGQKMITDMATGMMSARSSVASAAQSVMSSASGGLAGLADAVTRGAAGSAGGGAFAGAILPDRIANADTSILDAYLNHQFDDKRGLKGLAQNLEQFADLGSAMSGVMQQWQQTVMTMLTNNQKEQTQPKPEKPVSPSWNDVLANPNAYLPGAPVTASSSTEDIQRAIIASGRMRGMSNEDIQTALAVAAAESGFNPTISGGVQGSAGLVSGLFQQSPSSGWGTIDQVNDPQHAINAFYDAFAKQLAKNGNPLAAAVLTQNPQLGSNALSSDYARAVQAQMGNAATIMANLGGTGQQLPVIPSMVAPSGMNRAGPVLPGSTVVPFLPGGIAPNGERIAANMNSRASTLGGASANYTPQTMAAAGIAPVFTKTAPGSMDGAPAWVSNLASAFGLTASSHADTTLHGGVGQMGSWAFDFSGSTDSLQTFASFIANNLAEQTLQLIWQNPQTGKQLGIAGGQIVGPNQYYTGSQGFGAHTDHVHWATDQPPVMIGSDGSAVPAFIAPTTTPGGIDQGIGVRSPGPGNFGSYPTQSDVSNQPAAKENQPSTAEQENAAESGGMMSNRSMMGLGSAGQIITSVFSDIKSGLDALAATQDIADRSVYGMRNTEDIVKVVQDSQKWIEFASNVATTVSAVMNTAAALTPSTFDANTAAEGGAQISSLVAGALVGVNQTISLAIQAYHVAGQYVGRFLSYATGFGQGNLMGNVRFLLDENTNRLVSYTEDNPLLKYSGAVPGFMNGWVNSPGQSQVTPGVGTLNIYAGPGQSPGEMMNESMWAINTGLTGAGAASKF